jgi:excisionase family DNA binding protein
MNKTVLTTGEVARICNVAPRTVSKWFDAGHLRGYRIPGSKDRRIPIEHLVRFMRAHGIPLNGLETGTVRVLLFDADSSLCDAIQSALERDGGFEVVTAGTALEAGALAQEIKPHVVIVDVSLPDVTPTVLTRFVRSRQSVESVCLIGTAQGLSEARGQALLQAGFDGYIGKPFDVRSLIELIEHKRNGVGASVES